MKQNNFDFLRFIFAFTVVVSHTAELSGQFKLQFLKFYFDTNIAVCSFFIISGFLITNSYINSQNILEYFKKRARRLLPAYIMVIIICTLLFSAISSLSIKDYFLNKELYTYFISNILFQNYIQPNLPGVFETNLRHVVNGALWTIKIEVSFYFIIPMLLYFFKKTSRKYIVLAGIYIASLGFQYLAQYFYHRTGNTFYKVMQYQLPGSMSFFASGMLLYFYFSFFYQYQYKILLPAIVDFIIEYYFGYTFFMPFSLACIIFFLAYNFKFLNKFGKYGDYSYGIYIYHFPFIQLMVYLGLFNEIDIWIAFFVIIISVIIIGILSWNLMEKKYLKRNPG